MVGKSKYELTVAGRTLSLVEWSRETGVSYKTLYSRMLLGWTPERVIGFSRVTTVEFRGQHRTLREISEITGISKETLRDRVKRGEPLEQTVTQARPRSPKSSI